MVWILKNVFSGQEHFVSSGKFVVGRKYEADLVCYNGAVSKNHALLHLEGDTVCVVDQGSQNGTFVNRNKLAAHQVSPLRNGDEIGFGMFRHSNGTMSQIFKEPYLVFTLVHREFIDVPDDSSTISSLVVSENNNNGEENVPSCSIGQLTAETKTSDKGKEDMSKTTNENVNRKEEQTKAKTKENTKDVVTVKTEKVNQKENKTSDKAKKKEKDVETSKTNEKNVNQKENNDIPSKKQTQFEEEAKRRKAKKSPEVATRQDKSVANIDEDDDLFIEFETSSSTAKDAPIKRPQRQKSPAKPARKVSNEKKAVDEDDLFTELDESMCGELTVPTTSKERQINKVADNKLNLIVQGGKSKKSEDLSVPSTSKKPDKRQNGVKLEDSHKKVMSKKGGTPKGADLNTSKKSEVRQNGAVVKRSKSEDDKNATSKKKVGTSADLSASKKNCVVMLEKIRVKDVSELIKKEEVAKRESRKRSRREEEKVVEEKRARQSDETKEKAETNKSMNHSYSFTDEVIIIGDDDDDDEEDFMLSQVFVKEEPQIPTAPTSHGPVDEAVFKTIKMEVSEMDQLEDYSKIPPIVVDSQDFGLGPEDNEFLETIYGKECGLECGKESTAPMPDKFDRAVDYNNVDIVYDGADDVSEVGSCRSDTSLRIAVTPPQEQPPEQPPEPGPSRVNEERPCKITRRNEGARPRGQGKVHVKLSSGRGDFLLDGAGGRPWSRRRRDGNRGGSSDALLPIVNRYQNKSRRILEEYGELISSILTWNKSWFDEQTRNSAPPPVSKKNVISMCRTFSSYKDYFDVVHPLITLDLWYQISKDFKSDAKHRYSKQSFNSRVISVNHFEGHMEVVCNSYLNAQDYSSGNHLWEKHLVNVVFKIGSTACIRFGIVAWMDKAKFKPEDFIDIEEARKCKGRPVGRLTFMLIVRSCSVTVSTPAVGRYFPSLCNYLRQYSSLMSVKSSPLLNYILDPKKENHVKLKPLNRPVAKHNMELNRSQKEAVLEATALISGPTNGVYLIDGPPGTGKSTVITTIVLEAILKQKVLLLLAPSNGAIDSLVEKLAVQVKPAFEKENKERIRLVRIGPNTTSKAARYTLDSMARFNIKKNTLQSHQAVQKDYNNLENDLAFLKKKWDQFKDNDQFKALYQKKRKELEDFFSKVLGQRRYNAEFETQKQSLLKGANVICSTIGSCSKLRGYGFDFKQISACIVDEASQCCEVDTLLPLCHGVNKLILVGDAKQLPAVTSSVLTSMFGYGQSLFERLKTNLERFDIHPKLLDIQYRMNPEISLYPNTTFYQKRLNDAPSFRTKPQLENLRPYMVFGQMMTNHNVYRNYNEVICIRNLLQAIIEVAKPGGFSIGIITPYADQKEALNVILSKSNFEGIEIICNTIDGFQGQEKDIILISCVRNMTNSFLEDEKRLNVALTRARHALYIIGNQNLFESSKTLRSLYLDAFNRNAYCKLQRADFESSVFASLILRPTR